MTYDIIIRLQSHLQVSQSRSQLADNNPPNKSLRSDKEIRLNASNLSCAYYSISSFSDSQRSINYYRPPPPPYCNIPPAPPPPLTRMSCARCQSGVWSLLTQSCLHATFLLAFIVFLVVGVALTCLGYLDYGNINGSTLSYRTYRILGILALLLCIGFLIAACVVISECVSTALGTPADYTYQALYPSTDGLGSSVSFSQGVTQSSSMQMPGGNYCHRHRNDLLSRGFSDASSNSIQNHCASCTCSSHAAEVGMSHSRSLYNTPATVVQSPGNCLNSIIPHSRSYAGDTVQWKQPSPSRNMNSSSTKQSMVVTTEHRFPVLDVDDEDNDLSQVDIDDKFSKQAQQFDTDWV